MVAQTHRYVSSFSKLTLELSLEVRVLPLPFADQTTSRMVADWDVSSSALDEVHLSLWGNGHCMF